MKEPKFDELSVEQIVQAIIDDDPELEVYRADLNQAIMDMKQGKYARITRIDVSPIVEMRNKAGLTQTKFAACLGISVNTLRSWEQGQRKPSGAASVLLNLLHKRPELVQELSSYS